MEELIAQWRWPESLAVVKPGTVVQVERMLFGAIRDGCARVGVVRGSVLTCLEHGDDWVDVELPDGERHRLSRAYAWFISVKAPG